METRICSSSSNFIQEESSEKLKNALRVHIPLLNEQLNREMLRNSIMAYYVTSEKNARWLNECEFCGTRRSQVEQMARVVILHSFSRVTCAIFCKKCEERIQNCDRSTIFCTNGKNID